MFQPEQELEKYLDVLFPSLEENELIEIRMYPTDKKSKIKPFSKFYSNNNEVIQHFDELIRIQSKGYSVAVGVCPRKKNEKRDEQTGTKVDVSCINFLWADIDAKNFAGDKQKAWETIQMFKLKPTMIIDTGHGYHSYWKLKEPQTNKDLIECYLEGISNALNGDPVSDVSRVLRLPGTVNNKEEANHLSVKMVEIKPEAVYALSEFDSYKEKIDLNPKVNKVKKDKNWITNAINELKDGNRHRSFFKLIGRFINNNFSSEETYLLLEPHAEKSEYPITELKDDVDDGYMRYPKQSDKEIKYTAHFDGLVDIVDDQGIPAFLIKDKDKLVVQSEWIVDGNRVLPPPKVALPWLLPRAEEVLKHYSADNDKQLYADLHEYHKSISVLPSDEYYDLFVAWDFHTYLLEHFKYTPFLYFYAVTERGKSRTGKGLIFVSYRGFRTENLNEAQFIRLSNDCRATIFIDVTNFWKNADNKDIVELILGRFEKDSKATRITNPDKGAFKDTTYYDVYGPLIIATNVKVPEVLETRAIEINMPESDAKFAEDLIPETSLPLRERLVAFRARHIDRKLPDINKPTNGRLGDILKPLFQIVKLVNPNKEVILLKLAEAIEAGRRIDRSEGPEAILLKTVIDLEPYVDQGLLKTSLITEQTNRVKLDRYKVSPTRIGKDLVAMGLIKRLDSDGDVAIVYDLEKINRLKSRYGLAQISDSSDLSEISNNLKKDSDIPEISEVSGDNDAEWRMK